MTALEGVRKHDGRVVAFDLARLTGSIARAACACDTAMMPDAARRVGHEIARATTEFLVQDGKTVPASADVRAMVVKLLRETRHESVAGAYSDHARAAASLLWRIRVVEPSANQNATGSPWDRRRLLESLRSAGVARDPAGEIAREVERRLVALGQERISPALIHAMASLVLSGRALDVRPYSARRLSFSLSTQMPHYDPASADREGLPPRGAALEAFWLQAVHSPEVVRAARENVLSLNPFPMGPSDDECWPAPGQIIDPLIPELAADFRDWPLKSQQPLWVRADGPERLSKFAQYLSLLSPAGVPSSPTASMSVLLHPPAENLRNARRATPITINLAGLLMREALRDPFRATVRISQAVVQAAKAHRDREEYLNLSPVRGRLLPVALAGLWNAAAWMQGEGVDEPALTRTSRAIAANFVTVVRGAIDNLRGETGMELCLTGIAPHDAVQSLWLRDREFLARDGVTLDASSVYDGGPSVPLMNSVPDLGERIDFIKDVGSAFNDPPSVVLQVPLGTETDLNAWRELFQALVQTGVKRMSLHPGGGARAMKQVTRTLRSHLEGYPLFEQFLGEPSTPASRSDERK